MSAITERTLVILKPDAVSRGLCGEILQRFERKGLSIVGMKLIVVDNATAEAHYAEHSAKPFFRSLTSFITASPVVVLALEGNGAIEVVRGLIGPTSGLKAPPGTIRGDLALSMQNNLVHASDSLNSAKREMELWFKAGELLAPGSGTGSCAKDALYSSDDKKK